MSTFDQAVLVLRWLREAVRVVDLARDNGIGLSTCYRHLHEALDVIAAQAPNLRSVLLAAHAAGYGHVNVDGTLIGTDRVSTAGPRTRKSRDSMLQPGKKVDLWWSGKHHRHGGNVQVLTAPDGWPVWVSPVRPGREHDTTCIRTHPDLLSAVKEFSVAGHQVLADLGYEGVADPMTVPVKKTRCAILDDATRAVNRTYNGVRARAEQGNAWLKNYRALRNVALRLCLWRIGVITAAVLVVLYLERDRTT